jgi:1-acyl-sn-glycerol-3-phosphate acyltransferase
MAGPRDAFSAGADRAAGERARRNRTPLLPAADAAVPPLEPPLVPEKPEKPDKPRPERASALHRPSPRATGATSPPVQMVDGRTRTRRKKDGVRLSVVGQTGSPAAPPGAEAAARPAKPRKAAAPKRPVAQSQVTPAASGTPDAGPAPAPQATAPDLTKHRPHPVGHPRPVADITTGTAYRSTDPHPVTTDPQVNEQALAAALTRQELTPKIEDLMAALIGALRTVAAASGKRPDEVEEQVARTLSYLGRRVRGDYTVDEFGFDKDWTEHVYLPVMRILYRQWFRVEVRGIENVPAKGSALIVGNHAGTIAFDALMVQVAVHDEHPNNRNLRLLGGDLVFKTPILADFSRKQGSTLAANSDAERLLARGDVVGVFPEGYKGVGKPFAERYKLQRFGRGGFVHAAVRTGAPIIPLSIVGSEETYPLIGNVPALARLFNAPYFPITPTWPWLGPLGLIPLPSKWIMQFGEPVPTAHLGKAAAEDPMLVFDLTDQIRETIQQTLYSLLSLRRTVFS